MPKSLFIILLAGLFSCSDSPEPPAVVLSGTVHGLQSGRILLVEMTDLESLQTTVIDSIPIHSSGQFEFRGMLPPFVYQLELDGRDPIRLAIQAGQHVDVQWYADSARVTGSPDTDLLGRYETFRRSSLERLVYPVRAAIDHLKAENQEAFQDSIDELGILEITHYDLHRDELTDFVKTKMALSVAVYATTLRWYGDHHLGFYDSLATAMSLEYPNTLLSQKINDKVVRMARASVGGTVPDIELPTVNGQMKKLSSVDADLILIDFWASWCPPCRREAPDLVALYQDFKSEGFEIYGVSLDTDSTRWVNAMTRDNRTWTNVSSLEGLQTQAALDYSVTALPVNLLIDRNRQVIATNIHGPSLMAKVRGILGTTRGSQ